MTIPEEFKTRLKIAKSKINASKLNLKTTAYSNFLYFVDSVKFDAKIETNFKCVKY